VGGEPRCGTEVERVRHAPIVGPQAFSEGPGAEG
jgi:hypothetical protein